MKHKILRLIVVILLGLFVFAKANPGNPTVVKINELLGRKQELILTGATDTGETLPTDLTGIEVNASGEESPENENQNQAPVMCTMEYAPVCAEVQVQCIRAPCPPIKQTFGNKCQMNANKLAKFLYNGECSGSSSNKADCPTWSQPAPSFCPDGTIVDGGTDDNGCDLPPKCQK